MVLWFSIVLCKYDCNDSVQWWRTHWMLFSINACKLAFQQQCDVHFFFCLRLSPRKRHPKDAFALAFTVMSITDFNVEKHWLILAMLKSIEMCWEAHCWKAEPRAEKLDETFRNLCAAKRTAEKQDQELKSSMKHSETSAEVPIPNPPCSTSIPGLE